MTRVVLAGKHEPGAAVIRHCTYQELPPCSCRVGHPGRGAPDVAGGARDAGAQRRQGLGVAGATGVLLRSNCYLTFSPGLMHFQSLIVRVNVKGGFPRKGTRVRLNAAPLLRAATAGGNPEPSLPRAAV